MKKYILRNKIKERVLETYVLRRTLDNSKFKLEIWWEYCEILFEADDDYIATIDLKNEKGFIPQNQIHNIIDIKLKNITAEEFDFDFEDSPMSTDMDQKEGLISGYNIDGIPPLLDLWSWEILENYVDISDELELQIL